jgi:hypothetical protein
LADPVGGFQSGFHARLVPRAEAVYPAYLVCSHQCPRLVQLVSHVSNAVEFELCEIEAERLAHVLLAAVRHPRLGC